MKSLSYILLLAVPFFISCVGDTAADPEAKRLSEDIQRWEGELDKASKRARLERDNASLINSEIELIKSRIERLKERLKSRPH